MLWTGSEAQTMPNIHDRYGPVVRTAPRELSFNDASAWKTIYGHKTGTKLRTFEKDPKFYNTDPKSTIHIGTADDPNHTRQRRILANSFSDKVCYRISLLRAHVPLHRRQIREDATAEYSRTKSCLGVARSGAFAEAMGDFDGH